MSFANLNKEKLILNTKIKKNKYKEYKDPTINLINKIINNSL